jgi:hypothetical protein
VSNRPKPKARPNSLERYRSEVKGEPFVLWIDDENCLEIPRPTGDQMLEVEEAYGSRATINALCGDKAEEFFAIVGKEDGGVLRAIAADMEEHFGLGN